MSSRMENTIRNLKYSATGQILMITFSFVTRMIFLRYLSIEYLGIHGLFANILSLLTLAELGFASAIVYKLYEPLAKKEEKKIVALMTLFKKVYFVIGFFVLGVGLVLVPFLNHLIQPTPEISHLTLIYILFVLNSSFTYFFSYFQSLMIADQKDYIISFHRSLYTVLMNVSQIIIIITTQNFLLFILLEIIFNLLRNISLAIKTKKEYPFLSTVKTEKIEPKEMRDILKNVKALIFHKFGEVAVLGMANIFLALFAGLDFVGKYSSYLMIINGLTLIINMFFRSMTGSFGNLVVSEEYNSTEKKFRIINFINFWIVSIFSICLVIFFNPFVYIWLGNEDLVLSLTLVAVIVFDFYLLGMRKAVLMARNVLGLFWYDRYKPLLEALVYLISALTLGNMFGAIGILFSSALSTIIVCLTIEPYVLYKYGFKQRVKNYYSSYFKYIMVTLIALVVIVPFMYLLEISTFIGLIIISVSVFIILNIGYSLLFWKNAEFKYLKNLVYKKIRKA